MVSKISAPGLTAPVPESDITFSATGHNHSGTTNGEPIANAGIAAAAAIDDSKLAQIITASKVSGAAITAISSLPVGAGTIPLANLAGITNTELAAGAAIVDTKLAQITTASKVSGAAITSLPSLPSGAGVIPSANLPAGNPITLKAGIGTGDTSYNFASSELAAGDTIGIFAYVMDTTSTSVTSKITVNGTASTVFVSAVNNWGYFESNLLERPNANTAGELTTLYKVSGGSLTGVNDDYSGFAASWFTGAWTLTINLTTAVGTPRMRYRIVKYKAV